MDCRDQILSCLYLQHEPPNTRFESAVHQVSIRVHREEHDRLTQTEFQQPIARFNTAEPRHLEIGYDHIRIQMGGDIHERQAIPRDSDDFKFFLKKRRNLVKQVLMIVS